MVRADRVRIVTILVLVLVVLGVRGTFPGFGTTHIESANIVNFDQARNRTNTIGLSTTRTIAIPLPSLVRIYRQKLFMMANDELGDRIPGDVRDIRIKVLGYILSMHREPFL